MTLVIDASIAMGWLIASQASSLTEAALEAAVRNPGLVPAHFGMEIAISLRRLERRGLLASARMEASLARLKLLRLRQDATNAVDTLSGRGGPSQIAQIEGSGRRLS